MASNPLSSEQVKKAFSRRLVAVRKAKGLTQHDLSDEFHTSLRTVSQLERGLSEPRLSTILELARSLQVEPNVLVDDLNKEL
ncbi:MAG: helix-turn-helix transcriptional regulator [Bacteroidota bacterium]